MVKWDYGPYDYIDEKGYVYKSETINDEAFGIKTVSKYCIGINTFIWTNCYKNPKLIEYQRYDDNLLYRSVFLDLHSLPIKVIDYKENRDIGAISEYFYKKVTGRRFLFLLIKTNIYLKERIRIVCEELTFHSFTNYFSPREVVGYYKGIVYFIDETPSLRRENIIGLTKILDHPNNIEDWIDETHVFPEAFIGWVDKAFS